MSTTTSKRIGVVAGAAVVAAGVMAAAAGAAKAAPATQCETAGSSGFDAAVVATHDGQRIAHRMIDASGCDVGIYVADGVSDVTISHVTVTGANSAGILVQNTSHVTITHAVVRGNGFNAAPPPAHGALPAPDQLAQAFGISLFGVSHATITHNIVYNNGRGGIGVMDNGPFDPGQLGGASSLVEPVPSSHVVVSHNTLWANDNGCAIVVSPFNTGDHMTDVAITRNTVIGTGGADVGGIVAQTNAPGSVLSNVTISRNTVIGSGEAGVIVHATPASQTKKVDVTRNTLIRNNLSNTETGHTTGVVVSTLAPPGSGAANINTTIARNVIVGQFYGVYNAGPDRPILSRNTIVVARGGTAFYVAPTA